MSETPKFVPYDTGHMISKEVHVIEQEPIHFGIDLLKNPKQYIEETIKLYERHNLFEWAPSETVAEQIEQMSPKNRELVERYQREGWIAMLMPSKSVQKETLAKAIENLKPLWYKNGVKQTLEKTYIDDIVAKLIHKNHPALFRDLPDQPYIELTNPSLNVLPNTTNKTVKEQREEFKRMKKNDRNLRVIGISGFLAMQVWSTEKQFFLAKVKNEPSFAVNPIDDMESSGTNFIDLPNDHVGSGRVPTVGFYQHDRVRPGGHARQLQFGVLRANIQSPRSGFRVVVRVPIP